MNVPATEPARAAVETAAQELSERHTALEPRAQPLDSLDHIASLGPWLTRARALLADPPPEAAKAAWLGLAFTALHEGDRASRVLHWLNPITRTATRKDVARHRTEPYVLVADIGGVAPHVGRGGWTWYTGSAAWTWRLAVEGVLGLRLREGHLDIEPCVPPTWDRFEARIRRAGGTLAVTIELSSELTPGRREIVVDGRPCEEADLAFPSDGSTRAVHVRVGRPAVATSRPVGLRATGLPLRRARD
jgi:hypothetical protein